MQEFNLIWMQGQTCAGDSMSVINATEPDFLGFLERNKINLLYHPTLSPVFGDDAQELFNKCLSGEIPVQIFVFEGSIPTKKGFGDFFEMEDVRSMVTNFANQAMLTIAVGTCAAYGGLPAAEPNETGAVGMQWTKYEIGGLLGEDFMSMLGLPVVNIPGCPTHPDFTPELADRLSRARRVLFIDADWEGREMHLERVDEERTAPGHTFSPGGLLSLTHAVCGAAPEGWLLAVPGYDFRLGERVSEEAEALLLPATKAILDWVRKGGEMNPVSNEEICIGHERRGGIR